LKKKIIVIASIFVIVAISVVTTFATNDWKLPIFFASHREEELVTDDEQIAKQETLFPSFSEAEFLEGEILVTIPLDIDGSGDGLHVDYVEEMNRYAAGQAFTVRDDGHVFVYDVDPTKQWAYLYEYVDGVLVEKTDVYTNGSIFYKMIFRGETLCAAALYENKVYEFRDGALQLIDEAWNRLNGELSTDPQAFRSTPQGGLMIGDTVDHAVRVRRVSADGTVEKDVRQGVFVSDSIYVFEDADGNNIYMVDNGLKNHILVTETEDGKRLASNRFCSYEGSFGADSGGQDPQMQFFGVDAKGRAYFELTVLYQKDGTLVPMDDSQYLMRIDNLNGTVETVRIPDSFTIHADYGIEGYAHTSGIFVAADGSVYKAYCSLENGFQIRKFTFES